jgi:mycofactocin precursor
VGPTVDHVKGITVTTSPAEKAPVSEVTEDTLIEDVSIDGMCGVY